MKYGIFKKGGYVCLVAFETREKAEELIKGRQDLEVREIINDEKVRLW